MKWGAIVVAGILVSLFGLLPAVTFLLMLVGSMAAEDESSQSGGVRCAKEEMEFINGAFSGTTYSGEQILNAKIIIDVGVARGMSVHGQTIAVMTAIGESTLRNITYGDAIHGVTNPDGTLTSSIGLFQQQKWYEPMLPPGPGEPGHGFLEARLDPVYAAGKFYDDLERVPAWETLEPTIAAHEAQRNKDAYHYEKYWEPAALIVERLVDKTTIEAMGMIVGESCLQTPDDALGTTVTDGWASPGTGDLTSGFGPRNTGISGASTNHLGTDLANACGTPMYAAANGTVVSAGMGNGGIGNVIQIDHGGGVVTFYRHVLSGSFLVTAGQDISAGAQIAQVGGDKAIDPQGAGHSSGCHLHFEVVLNGVATDPVPFMAARGITLGAG